MGGFDRKQFVAELDRGYRKTAKETKRLAGERVRAQAAARRVDNQEAKAHRDGRPKAEAERLRQEATALVRTVRDACKNKRSATYLGSETCTRELRRSGARAALLRAQASELLAAHSAQGASARVARAADHVAKLDPLLDALKDAQESARLHRLPKKMKSASARRRGGEKASEARQQNIANFPPHLRDFCTKNYAEIQRRIKGTRTLAHEACAEMAEEDEFEGSQDWRAAALGAFEGSRFERQLEREQAMHYGEPAPERKRKSKKPSAASRTSDLIFTLGGKPEREKKPRKKQAAKIVDPTTATSAARRTRPMFDDEPVPF